MSTETIIEVSDGVPIEVIDGATEETVPIGRPRPGVDYVDPNCPHDDVAPFEVVGVEKTHCWTCGRVFEPEEDLC